MNIAKIGGLIHVVRGQRVMLDEDLAVLYGVKTKYLNQMVRRNLTRFPADFMFQLTLDESRVLRLRFATLELGGRGRYRKYQPYVFTEHGVARNSASTPWTSTSFSRRCADWLRRNALAEPNLRKSARIDAWRP